MIPRPPGLNKIGDAGDFLQSLKLLCTTSCLQSWVTLINTPAAVSQTYQVKELILIRTISPLGRPH